MRREEQLSTVLTGETITTDQALKLIWDVGCAEFVCGKGPQLMDTPRDYCAFGLPLPGCSFS